MNVLSLFDGLSGGQLALKRAGIKVDKYYASEICGDAMKITNKRFPKTIQMGNVEYISAKDFDEPIDLILAGSPCQGFSQAGKRLNLDDPRSVLFFEFVRLLKELKPKYFMLENVKMDKKSRDIITEILGVEPILIDSNLVSAQNRKRYYWTNIPFNGLPKDKGIVLNDIIDWKVKRKYVPKNKLKRGKKTRNYFQYDVSGKGHKSQDQRGYYLHKKHGTVPSDGASSKVKFYKENADGSFKVGHLTVVEVERLQTLPDNYTDVGLSDSKRMSVIGNGWTIDIVAHILKGIKGDKMKKRKKNPTKLDQYMIFSTDGILSRRYWGTVPEDKVEAFIKEISIEQEIPLYEFEVVKLLDPKRKKNPQGKGRNLGYGTNNGGMVKNQLRTIQRVAQQLNDILLMDDEVPDWVLTKVNTAMDRLVVAHHYIQSKLQGLKPNPRVNVQSAIDHANEVVRELK